MLSSISPVGEASRRQRWGVTATAYLLGSAAGGALLGLVLGAVGAALLGGALIPEVAAPARLAALGAVALLGLVVDATTGVPTLHRQVDERWLTAYRGWVYGAGFGLQLGTGVVTIIPSSLVYAMWAGALLTADPLAGALVGTAFGVVRAAPLLASGRVRTVGGLRRALARMERARRPIARLAPVAQGLVGVAALAVSALALA